MKNAVCHIAVCLAVALLAGCSTVRYVAVPAVSVDSVYAGRWQRDSIYVLDSVCVERWAQGDTVFVDKVVTKYKYKDRWRHDTVAIVRVDTISVPYPVEKQPGWREKTRLYSFPVLLALVAVQSLVVFAIKRRWP